MTKSNDNKGASENKDWSSKAGKWVDENRPKTLSEWYDLLTTSSRAGWARDLLEQGRGTYLKSPSGEFHEFMNNGAGLKNRWEPPVSRPLPVKPKTPTDLRLKSGKPISSIDDASAFIFEILNSPTPAQLREKQKPVVYPKFPTSNRDRGEAGGETEALMRLMMPAKEKNRTPFPVPLAEIARVLLQPRP